MGDLLPGEVEAWTFRAGDRVIWRRVQRGGYGLITRVPATVVRIGKAKVTIEYPLTRGGSMRTSVHPWRLERPAPSESAAGKERT